MPGMSDMIIAVLGVSLAPVAIWLTVRITNRREPWAIWAAVALLVFAAAYPLSFGPACWMGSRVHGCGPIVSAIYRPVIRAWLCSPQPLKRVGYDYIGLGMSSERNFACAKFEDSRIAFMWLEADGTFTYE